MNKKMMKDSPVWQWKIIEYISYFIILIVPWIIGKNLIYSFTTSKSLMITFMVLVSVILLMWISLDKKESNIRINPVSITLVLFLAILTISSLLGVDPINSFFGWRYAVSLVHLYVLGIFSLIVGSLVHKDRRVAINLLALSLISSIVVTIIFYTGLSVNTDDGSTIGNSSYLGEYLFFNVIFGLGLFLYFKKYWKKILAALGSLFILLSPIYVNKDILLGKIGLIEAIKHPLLFLGIANGAAMGIGISILVTLLLLLAASRKKLIKIVGFVLLASFLFSVYYAGQLLVNPDSGLHKVYAAQKSGNRFLAWDIAKESLRDNKLLGVGVNNYPYSFEKYSTTDFYKEGYYIEKFSQPHNIFWEYASNTGVLGLVSFISLLSITLIFLFRKGNDEESNSCGLDVSRFRILKITLASIIIGYFVQNLFVFDTIATYLMLFLVIGVASGISSISWNIRIGERLDVLKKILAVILTIGSLVSMVVFVFLPMKEAKKWNSMMLSTQNILDLYESKEDIQGISVMGGLMDSVFISTKLFEPFQDNIKNVNASNKEKFLKVIDYTSSRIEQDIDKQPGYADAYFMIGNLLDVYMLSDIKEGGNLKFDGKNYNKEIWDRAYNSLTKSIELNPKNPKAYYALSKTYVIKGDIVNARLIAREAIDVAPWNKETYTFSRVLFGGGILDKNFEKYVNDMEDKWIKK